MGCKICSKGNQCTFHEGSTKLATGLQYAKEFRVYDLRTQQMTTLQLRASDRIKQPLIEIEEKTATCTKCRRMEICNNYFITTRSGGSNVCICDFCTKTQFANDTELFDYVKEKLLKRYQGSNSEIRQLLR